VSRVTVGWHLLSEKKLKINTCGSQCRQGLWIFHHQSVLVELSPDPHKNNNTTEEEEEEEGGEEGGHGRSTDHPIESTLIQGVCHLLIRGVDTPGWMSLTGLRESGQDITDGPRLISVKCGRDRLSDILTDPSSAYHVVLISGFFLDSFFILFHILAA